MTTPTRPRSLNPTTDVWEIPTARMKTERSWAKKVSIPPLMSGKFQHDFLRDQLFKIDLYFVSIPPLMSGKFQPEQVRKARQWKGRKVSIPPLMSGKFQQYRKYPIRYAGHKVSIPPLMSGKFQRCSMHPQMPQTAQSQSHH